MSTHSRDVTRNYDWHDALIEKLGDLAYAQTMLKNTQVQIEFRILLFACIRLEEQIAKNIQHLGGLGAAW